VAPERGPIKSSHVLATLVKRMEELGIGRLADDDRGRGGDFALPP
jgi:hypothetical protein